MENSKKLLENIVNALVDNPSDVYVESKTDEMGVLLTLHVAADDMGKVIGKQGRIIRALRDLIKLMAAKQGGYVDIELFEEVSQESPVPETA